MTTTHIAALFGIAFIITIIATPIAKWLGLKLGLVDNPDNYRKIHQNAIPLGGGIAVFLGFVIPIGLLIQNTKQGTNLPPQAIDMIIILIVGGSMAMLMGLADDLRNLKARWKILFQIFAASLAYSGGFRIEAISSPFGEAINLGLFSFMATMLWFLVCMNAINLVDGLDGLSAGIGLIVSLTLLGVSITSESTMGIMLNACLSGALLGFLIFNFNPASIFLGDSGSMLIGFLIAAISLLTRNKAETATALLIPLMALGLPIYDMAIAVVRRWSRRNPISVADRRHIHHSLLSLGFSHREAVIVLYGISLVLCLASVIMVITRSPFSAAILVLLALAMVVGTHVLKLIDISELRARLKQDHAEHLWRKSVTLKVESAIQRCAKSATLDELWEALEPAFETLAMSKVELFTPSHEGLPSLQWTPSTPEAGDPSSERLDSWEIRLELRCDDQAPGKICFHQGGHLRRTKNTGMLLDRLRGAIESQLGIILKNEGPDSTD